MKKNISIGFIGCGNMARAIIEALYENGYTQLTAADPNAAQLATVARYAKTTSDNQSVIAGSRYVFLCVKPQNAEEALRALHFGADSIPVSIMAGLPLRTVLAYTGASKGVRVMPNLNALVKNSYNAYCVAGLHAAEADEIHALLSSFGTADATDESLLNAVTGISGSGPAYIFHFFKGLMAEAERQGFSPAAAVRMCGVMMAGSVQTVMQTVYSTPPVDFNEALQALDQKIDSVCSKGGTTVAGVKVLNERDFSQTVSDAAAAAIKRAAELSR